MRFLRRSTAWAVVLCLILSLALTVVPAAAETDSETFDPYVYYYTPDQSMIPDYYERYARPYMLYSGHSVHHKGMDEGGYFPVRFFNVVNTSLLIEDEADAPAGGYATIGAFCSDAETYIVKGAAYRRMNLEDGYFNADSTAAGTVDARKIRAVLRNSMPNLADLPALEKKINDYLTATYGEEAVPVSGLTGSQLISAAQSAVWHYANGFDFSSPYPYKASDDFASWNADKIASTSAEITYPDYPTSFMDVANDTTGTNIDGVYQYLLSLPGEQPREIIITDESIALAEAVISDSGDHCDVTILLDIHGTINSDDELSFDVQCGDQLQRFCLGSVNTLEPVDGLYPITFTDVPMDDCRSVQVVLSGQQTVDDVCFYEAKPTGDSNERKSSQNLAGYGCDAAPVYCAVTVDAVEKTTAMSVTKVDAQSGNPLSGVAFDLYRKCDDADLKIGSYVTDAEGRITVSVTDSDDYYFVETKALKGYEAVTGAVTEGKVPNSWNAGSLEVSKKLINETPAQVGETFNFKLTLDLSTAPVMDNNIAWMTEEYLMDQLECSKELSWAVSGEQELTAVFTLNADEKVTVDSIPLGTAYTLEEVMTEEDRQWFHVTAQVDGQAAQKSNVASGSIASENAVLFTNSVATSEVRYGQLAVSKKLINTTPAQVGETFHFEITLDFSTADVYSDAAPWINDAYLLEQVSCSEDLRWTEADGKYTAAFTVNAEQTVIFEGLAYGATYTVEEVLTEEEQQWFTVTSKVCNDPMENSPVAQGNIAAVNAVLFTNSVVTGEVKLGDLEVSKKLVNTTPAQVGETFHFEITLDFSTADIYAKNIPWMNDDYLMDFVSSSEDLTWTLENGKYTAGFTVDADETVTFSGIAQGSTYTVEEILTEEEREWFQSSAQIGDGPAEGSLVQGTVAENNGVLFTNSVVTGPVLKLGDPSVSKKLINTTPAEVRETFDFEVTVDFSTADVYTDAAPWMNDAYLLSLIHSTKDLTWTLEDGKYTAAFTVNAEETVTLAGMAYGATYTFREILSQEDREWFNVTCQVGTEEAVAAEYLEGAVSGNDAVVFTNTVVTGPELELGDVEVSKKLVNTTPAQVGETFNFQIALDLSTADVYTDAAPWMNDDYLMSFITGTEELTWRSQDGKYIADFAVNADGTFSISGIAQGASYTVQEILTEEEREWFTVTSRIGEGEVSDSDTVESTVAQKNAVTFTNSVVTGIALNTGRVGVGKELTNAPSALTDQTYTFRITLDLADADIYQNPAPWMYDNYLLYRIESDQALSWTKSGEKQYSAIFTLKAGQTLNLDGVALGTGFEIEEILTAAERQNYRVTTSVSTNGGAAVHSDAALVSGNVADDNDVIFVNRYVAPIPVTDDLSLTAPAVLCLLSVMLSAVLMLNKRRFVG